MRQRSIQGVALGAVLIVLIGYALWLSSRGWFPEIVSEHGIGVQRMLDFTLIATGAFFLAGHLALAWLLFRSMRDRGAPPSRIGTRKEWAKAVVPALVMALVAEGGVLVFGLPVWDMYYGDPPADAMTVEVTGQQFRWLVRYTGSDGEFGRTAPELIKGANFPGLDARDPAAGDDLVNVGEMVVPVDRPVKVVLRSTDVIHSFFLPEFRVKQDAMPGMNIVLWFTPTKIGEFEIACNQICGLGHYQMRGLMRVVSATEFEEWLVGEEPFVDYL